MSAASASIATIDASLDRLRMGGLARLPNQQHMSSLYLLGVGEQTFDKFKFKAAMPSTADILDIV